jgi:PrtD family type I secretion system ABC transporter
MQKQMTFGPGYFVSAAVFISCVNLIYLSVPIYIMVVYDKALYSFSRSTLYTLSVGLIVALIAMVALWYLQHLMMTRAGDRMIQETTPHVMEAIRADTAGMRHTGYTRGLADLEEVRNAVAQGYLFTFLDLPWILVYLGILIIIHPVVGLLAAAAVFLTTMFQRLLKISARKRYAAADVIQSASMKFTSDCLGHARLLTSMQMLPALIRLYRAQQQPALIIRSGTDALYAGVGAVIRLIHLVGPALVFGAGAFVFFNDEITLGAIVAALAISFRLFYFFDQRLAEMPASISAVGAYKRLRTFVTIRPSENKLSLPEPAGKFDAKGITLGMPGKPLLMNISFDLAPGEMLGILGPAGAGKTCLCRVLTGIWAPSAGNVRLEGANFDQWPMEDLGKYMGYLAQTPVLFPVSVAQNIARLSEPDPDKVVAAAEKAGVHDMVLTLPQGYDTVIEVNSGNLSAGQRQGICLARALYNDPKVLVLDEPHTFLDDQGLQTLLTGLDRLRETDTTVVVVSDRPKILTKMDKLLMIKEGKSVMYGPAADVLAQLSGRQPARQTTGV